MFLMRIEVGLIKGFFIYSTKEKMLESLKSQCKMILKCYDYKNWDAFDAMCNWVLVYKSENEGQLCEKYCIRDYLEEYLNIEDYDERM